MSDNLDNISPTGFDNLDEDLIELQVGHIVKGIVVSSTHHFTVVKVGELKCILPASEIDFRKKSSVLAVGTEVEAVVIKITVNNGVMLSVKRAKKDPWETIDELYRVGQRIPVNIVNITDYGAFAETSDGIVGLIHESDLTYNKRLKPKDVVSIDQSLEVEIIDINKEHKKLGLSLKKCLEDPWEHVPQNYYVGQRITGFVKEVKDYGAFVELEPGVDALLHKTEMGLGKTDKAKQYVSIGDKLDLEISFIDIENKRISLKCDFSFEKRD